MRRVRPMARRRTRGHPREGVGRGVGARPPVRGVATAQRRGRMGPARGTALVVRRARHPAGAHDARAPWRPRRRCAPLRRLCPPAQGRPRSRAVTGNAGAGGTAPGLMDLRAELDASLSGAYRLERELGGGGMSRVFVAEELALGRKVVIKVLPPELAATVSIERFNREIRTTATLQHAHIVPVLTAGVVSERSGLPFYTMPYVDGESLRAE